MGEPCHSWVNYVHENMWNIPWKKVVIGSDSEERASEHYLPLGFQDRDKHYVKENARKS